MLELSHFYFSACMDRLRMGYSFWVTESVEPYMYVVDSLGMEECFAAFRCAKFEDVHNLCSIPGAVMKLIDGKLPSQYGAFHINLLLCNRNE